MYGISVLVFVSTPLKLLRAPPNPPFYLKLKIFKFRLKSQQNWFFEKNVLFLLKIVRKHQMSRFIVFLQNLRP